MELHWKKTQCCSGHQCMGWGILPNTSSVNTVSLLIHKSKLYLYHAKIQYVYVWICINNIQTNCCLLWSLHNLRLTKVKWENCPVVLFEIHGRYILQRVEEPKIEVGLKFRYLIIGLGDIFSEICGFNVLQTIKFCFYLHFTVSQLCLR